MTTAQHTTPPPEARISGRLAHPLERLQRTIRVYVGIESIAIVATYLAACFWLGMFFDYGFFKAFGVDWVQELPLWLRQATRIVVVAGLLYLLGRALVAVVRRFRSEALALVLERRFPEQLGDRLITAVELADPASAERLGYSRAMVEQTISEAIERVDALPLNRVFDWVRLRRLVLRALLYSVGTFVLVTAGYLLWKKMPLAEYLPRFRNVTAIWYERNILLWNTIWPRQAHLELIGFPESGEQRIGRDAPSPTLRVRATHWLVADHKAFEGWRPLAWHDIKPGLLGNDVRIPEVPDAWRQWTVDRIELELDRQQPGLAAQVHLDMRSLFQRLEELAAQPQMARRLRQLVVPDQIVIYYRGDTIRSEQTFQRQGEHEFTGVLSDLKESVRFAARAKDYYTPYSRITVVPPPGLVKLTRDEEQPAYLYHRLPTGEAPAGLRGKKQLFHDVPVSLSGGTSRIDVPAGANIVLKGESDKSLTPPEGSSLAPGPGIRLRPREGSHPLHPTIAQAGEHEFSIRFENITAPLDFDLQLVDTDNVSGLRHVVIKPSEDTPPDVDVVVEVLRKNSQGYLATPSAKIPISGKIRDDHGLARVDYRYTLSPLDTQGSLLAGPIGSLFGGSPLWFDPASMVYLSHAAALTRSLNDEAAGKWKTVELATFTRRLRESENAPVPLAELVKKLATLPDRGLLRDLTLDPEEEALDLQPLGLKVTDERTVQPRYRLRLEVAAVDTNVETGPGVGANKERFTIAIISENELLTVIAEEEESLQVKLQDAVDRLKDARGKLDQVLVELPLLKPDEFSPMARRTEELQETLVKSWDVCQEVHRDYRKILKELRVNRVEAKIIEKVERNICEPLEAILAQEFVRSDEALKDFHKSLEEKKQDPAAGTKTRQEFDRLIDKLQGVLDAMGELMTINKLIEQLVKIDAGEGAAKERIKQILEKKQKEIFDDLFNKPTPPANKPEKKKP